MKFSSIFEKNSQRRGAPPPEPPTIWGPLLGGGNKLAPPEKNHGYATVQDYSNHIYFVRLEFL